MYLKIPPKVTSENAWGCMLEVLISKMICLQNPGLPWVELCSACFELTHKFFFNLFTFCYSTNWSNGTQTWWWPKMHPPSGTYECLKRNLWWPKMHPPSGTYECLKGNLWLRHSHDPITSGPHQLELTRRWTPSKKTPKLRNAASERIDDECVYCVLYYIKRIWIC